MSFSRDWALLARGSGDDTYGTIRLWDPVSGQETATLRGHRSAVSSVSFSPDGALLASGSLYGTVRLWDVASGQEKAVLQSHTSIVRSLSFSPDAALLASAGDDETVRLWDVADGRETATLLGHTHRVRSVAFSPDGARLASSSEDGTILLWDMAPYVTAHSAVEASTPTLPAQTALLANYPNPFNSRTRLAYRLAAPGPVRLEIHNALGQPVRTLVDQVQAAGECQVAWDARDGRGTALAMGVYLARLRAPDAVRTRRLLYLK